MLTWTVELYRPGRAPETAGDVSALFERALSFDARFGDLRMAFASRPADGGRVDIEIELTSGAPAQGFVALSCQSDDGAVWHYGGEAVADEVFRQSPHDPANHGVQFAKQAAPMAAMCAGGRFFVAVSDHPGTCGNATTQRVMPAKRRFTVASGDPGDQPGQQANFAIEARYHAVAPGAAHRVRLVVFMSQAAGLNRLRLDLFRHVAAAWGGIDSGFGALCFATNYLHLRLNETGYSRLWVVPGIEYANKQYTRDAFWQSLILPADIEQQIYDAVYPERYRYAENGLLYLLWSARLARRGGTPCIDRAADALAYVEEHVKDGFYEVGHDGSAAHLKSWYDLCLFEPGDAITYNQGLLPGALRAASELGLRPSASHGEAAERYRAMFLNDRGYFPLSRQKTCFAVDPLVGDLLHGLLFDGPLLPKPLAQKHFDTLQRIARTEHGYKVTCGEDGSILPGHYYSIPGRRSPLEDHPPGSYQRGGSWFLYDMLCLLACQMHGVRSADEQAIWRTALDIRKGGTYHECIDTVTGKPDKANQGWNAAIYVLWKQLIGKGLATRAYIDAIEAELENIGG